MTLLDQRADLSTAQKLLDLLSPSEKRSAAALLGLMCVGAVLETLSVGLVVPLVVLLTQQDLTKTYPKFQSLIEGLGHPSREEMLAGGMFLLVGLYALKAAFLAFLGWRENRFSFGLQAQLSQRLFMHYMRQPYTFHLQQNSARLIRNTISEVGVLIIRAVMPGIMLLTESLVLIGLCGLLLFIEPLGVVVVGIVLGIAAWGFHRLTRGRITRWGEVRLHHEGLRVQHVQQGLGGAKELKLLGREEYCLEQYKPHNLQSARASELMHTLQRFPRLGLELLAISGLAMLVISMLAQHRPIEAVLPTLGLFAAVAFRLMPSVHRVLGAVQAVRYTKAVIDVLHRELSTAVPDAGPSPRDVQPILGALELKHVSYSYPSDTAPVIQDISLTIQRGESVGFIGASGAGKSTLVDLILGLLAPAQGEILVDGGNIQSDLRNWQCQIGYVPQSIFLTDDTLRRNVAFGLPEKLINDAAVHRAIQAAQLVEFVESLPNGLETLVGERGVRLSGGQRQRIGIARALYHDPAVLVLDEATSALDIATEGEVIKAVAALQGTKTTIIVAHRLSTVEHCNHLYRLHDGKLVEEGTPAAVLAYRQTLKVDPSQAGER